MVLQRRCTQVAGRAQVGAHEGEDLLRHELHVLRNRRDPDAQLVLDRGYHRVARRPEAGVRDAALGAAVTRRDHRDELEAGTRRRRLRTEILLEAKRRAALLDDERLRGTIADRRADAFRRAPRLRRDPELDRQRVATDVEAAATAVHQLYLDAAVEEVRLVRRRASYFDPVITPGEILQPGPGNLIVLGDRGR